MHEEIMDDINSKAREDTNRMVFFGPNVSTQSLMFFQGKISDAPEGTDYPPPLRVMLNPEFRGRGFVEISKALDKYLEAFEKIELMALTEAIREVISSNSNQDMLYCLEELLAANDDDGELPDDVELWQAYDNSELQDVVDTIGTIHQNRREEYAKVISLVTGIDFKAN